MDLDLAFGDVAISLQLLPQNSMSDLIAMSGHLDGQGLSSIVTKHDGHIFVESKSGEGTVITIDLPATRQKPAAPATPIEDPPAQRSHNEGSPFCGSCSRPAVAAHQTVP